MNISDQGNERRGGQVADAWDRVQVSHDGHVTAEHFELSPNRLDAFRQSADLQAGLR